jgi:hypothetical protein
MRHVAWMNEECIENFGQNTLKDRDNLGDRIIAYSGGWSPNWVHLAPRPFTVLLCLHRVIVRIENYSVE